MRSLVAQRVTDQVVLKNEADLIAARPLIERALELIEPRTERPDFRSLAVLAFSRAGCLTEQEGDLAASARWHTRALQGRGWRRSATPEMTTPPRSSAAASLNGANGRKRRDSNPRSQP